MNRHVTRWLLALYPRAWRDRYGAEVVSLTNELIRAGETTPLPAGLNLVAGAAVERARALAGSRSALLVSSAAVIVALAGGSFAITGSARPDPAPRSLASSNCVTAPAVHISLPSRPAAARLPPVSPQFKAPFPVRRVRLMIRSVARKAAALRVTAVSRLHGPVLRPALARSVRPPAQRRLMVITGGCLRPRMIKALISGSPKTLRVPPPVPAVTRVKQ
jgi:hypothetical protein